MLQWSLMSVSSRPRARGKVTTLATALLTVCIAVAIGVTGPASSAAAATEQEPGAIRIGTVDWTIAEILLSLGVVPTAVAQTTEYQAWVGEPALPDSVVDLGLRAQPNRELVAALNLDHFLLSPLFQALEPTLSRIVPVTSLSIYSPGGDLWQSLTEATRKTAAIAGVPDRAETVIDDHRRRIEQVRERLPDAGMALLVVQFIDSRHVRVYGKGSLFQMVLDRLDLENAWRGGTNLWGYATVGIEDLTAAGHLVVVDPIPMGVAGHLADNRIWQALPAVAAGRVIHLPAVWSFGALPSAARFAEELGRALGRTRQGGGDA